MRLDMTMSGREGAKRLAEEDEQEAFDFERGRAKGRGEMQAECWDLVTELMNDISRMAQCGVMRSMDNTVKSNTCGEISTLAEDVRTKLKELK